MVLQTLHNYNNLVSALLFNIIKVINANTDTEAHTISKLK